MKINTAFKWILCFFLCTAFQTAGKQAPFKKMFYNEIMQLDVYGEYTFYERPLPYFNTPWYKTLSHDELLASFAVPHQVQVDFRQKQIVFDRESYFKGTLSKDYLGNTKFDNCKFEFAYSPMQISPNNVVYFVECVILVSQKKHFGEEQKYFKKELPFEVFKVESVLEGYDDNTRFAKITCDTEDTDTWHIECENNLTFRIEYHNIRGKTDFIMY